MTDFFNPFLLTSEDDVDVFLSESVVLVFFGAFLQSLSTRTGHHAHVYLHALFQPGDVAGGLRSGTTSAQNQDALLLLRLVVRHCVVIASARNNHQRSLREKQDSVKSLSPRNTEKKLKTAGNF